MKVNAKVMCMEVTLPVVVYTFCVVGTVGVVNSVWRQSPNYISSDGYLFSSHYDWNCVTSIFVYQLG